MEVLGSMSPGTGKEDQELIKMVATVLRSASLTVLNIEAVRREEALFAAKIFAN